MITKYIHIFYITVLFIQGSWKQSLRNSFKNFRRDHFFDENNQSTKRQSAASSQPPSKRHKAQLDECETLSEDDYEEALAELQTEWKKGKKGGRNHSVIKQLMEKTASTRHRWITDERPLVSQVLEKYPLLKESRMVSGVYTVCVRY